MSAVADLEIGDSRVEFMADYVIKTLKCKPDRWMKMYNVDETKQLFMDWFEKPDLLSMVVINNPGGSLTAQYEWPTNPKQKACYFVKKSKDGISKDVPFRQAVLYGDLSYSPLDQLQAFVDEISWTPGHSDIKGNEYADQLAKEAAEEANQMKDLPPIITLSDVKAGARKSGTKKWQEMWETSERGRNLFSYRPEVGFKLKHKFDSRKGESLISQLRTGYIRLNEYQNKTNITTNNKCQCGEIETAKHYLLECVLYENEREQMRQKLFETCGISHFDMNLLLEANPDEDFKEWRSFILSELETFVAGTNRFTTQ